MNGYHHRQHAPLCWLVYAIAVGCLVTGVLARQEPVLLYILGPTALFLFVIAAAFHHLTVVDLGDRLGIQFGPLPLFRTSLRYDRMKEVAIDHTTFLDGWGIHISLRGGWVWNIWGFDCVTIYHQGGILRVGTDDPVGLAAFLQAKIGGPVGEPESEYEQNARRHLF